MRWEATLIRRGRGGESLAPGAGGGDFDGRGYQPRTSSSRDPRQLTLPPGGPDPRFDSPQYSQRPPQYTHRTPQYDYRTGPQYDHRTPQCEQRTPQCEQSAPQYDQWTPQYERGTPAHPPTIYFYERHQPYYGFTNFSPYEVRYKGKVYPTSEHLFQAMKFLEHKPPIAELIRTVSRNPRLAFNEARLYSEHIRKDWRDVNVRMMDEVLRLKFEQHPALKEQLLSTGDAYLVEDSGANDTFWGNGADGNGRNELGLALMRLRDHFRWNGTRC